MLGAEPVININDTWVEQGVAPYTADRFELRLKVSLLMDVWLTPNMSGTAVS